MLEKKIILLKKFIITKLSIKLVKKHKNSFNNKKSKKKAM